MSKYSSDDGDKDVQIQKKRGVKRGSNSFKSAKGYRLQKYREEWQEMPEFKSWLQPVWGNLYRAQCTLCGAEFKSALSTVKYHASTAKHASNSAGRTQEAPVQTEEDSCTSIDELSSIPQSNSILFTTLQAPLPIEEVSCKSITELFSTPQSNSKKIKYNNIDSPVSTASTSNTASLEDNVLQAASVALNRINRKPNVDSHDEAFLNFIGENLKRIKDTNLKDELVEKITYLLFDFKKKQRLMDTNSSY